VSYVGFAAAQERPVAFQGKARKDVVRAAHLVLALDELRPGDLRTALAAAKG
jgi:hypothetical protein